MTARKHEAELTMMANFAMRFFTVVGALSLVCMPLSVAAGHPGATWWFGLMVGLSMFGYSGAGVASCFTDA